MAQISCKPDISPEILSRLASGKDGIWTAAHADGSDNRINTGAVLDAATYGTSFGILSALGQWIRKKFRNRDKTKEDLSAEKEAAAINVTCGALSQMLLDYFRDAQAGNLDPEALDDLIGTLKEVEGYEQAGKLKVNGEKELAAIAGSISKFTAILTGAPAPNAAAGGFRQIREQLALQKEWLEK